MEMVYRCGGHQSCSVVHRLSSLVHAKDHLRLLVTNDTFAEHTVFNLRTAAGSHLGEPPGVLLPRPRSMVTGLQLCASAVPGREAIAAVREGRWQKARIAVYHVAARRMNHLSERQVGYVKRSSNRGPGGVLKADRGRHLGSTRASTRAGRAITHRQTGRRLGIWVGV